MVDRFRALDRLFRARGVCVVGASEDPRKLASRALAHLVRHRYAGALYAVNPRYQRLGDVPCVPSVEALPDGVDVALIGVPAPAVPDVVEACGRRGVAAAVVISSGFEETAPGRDLACRLADAARRHGVAVVGPNCEGVWSVRERLLLTFGSAADREVLHEGPIAVVSQSGAVGGAVVRHLQDAGYGCAQFVSVGNETVLSALDYVEYLVEQDDLLVIALFVEALREGRRLPALAERARRRGIEIVALKAGGSRLGREATASHTGKIASDDAVYRSVFAEAGVLQVEGLVDLVDAAALLSWAPPPRRLSGARPGVGVLSVPGGTRALTADLAERAAVPLAAFDEATVASLAATLPAFGYPRNPADVTGEVLNRPDLLEASLAAVAADPNVEALVVQFANAGPRDARARRDLLARTARSAGMPLVAACLGDAMPAEERRAFAEGGVLVARDPSEAIRSLAWLYRRREHMALPGRQSGEAPPAGGVPKTWDGQVAFLAGAGVPVPPWVRVAPGDDVARAAAALPFPVVVKAVPEAADHKTEAGLVALGLADARATAAAAREMWRRTDAPLLVQAMVRGGVEALVACLRDPDFGPVVALGAGGTLVEVVAEVGYVLAPPEPEAVRRLLLRLSRLSRLLGGVRGAPAADVEALVEAVVRVGRAAAALPGLAELELNPLFVLPQGVVAVDVLVKEVPS